jgi:hypothetical protein
LNNQTSAHQKKNKTSHVHEKTVYKQESSTIISTTTTTTTVKNEQNMTSSNDIDNKIRTALLPTTVIPITSTQPKKEKPTAK